MKLFPINKIVSVLDQLLQMPSFALCLKAELYNKTTHAKSIQNGSRPQSCCSYSLLFEKRIEIMRV